MASFPTSYDTVSANNLFGNLADLIVMTITGSIGTSDTTVVVSDAAQAARLSIYTDLTFADTLEIVRITGIAGTTLTISRGFGGTTPAAHNAGTVITQDPLAWHIQTLRNVLAAAQKYAGLVGTLAARPATCAPGEVYICTDNNTVYVCLAANTWSVFNRPSHGSYAGLLDDDHTQYHNDARKATWHDALPGDHISTIAHNHDGTGTNGNPVAKFRTGLNANKGTPSAVGQVYYSRDSGDLYFSADGDTWTRYSIVPAGTIMFFETACPAGWEAVSALNNRFPKGAAAGVYSGLLTGGSDTHSHSLPGVINHTHSVAQAGATTTTDGHHSHQFNYGNSQSGGAINPFISGDTYSTTWYTGNDGGHTHTVSAPAMNTNSDGSGSAASEVATSLPTFYQLVACRKT